MNPTPDQQLALTRTVMVQNFDELAAIAGQAQIARAVVEVRAIELHKKETSQ